MIMSTIIIVGKIEKYQEKNIGKDKDKEVEAEIEEKDGQIVDFKAMNMENNKNIAIKINFEIKDKMIRDEEKTIQNIKTIAIDF
jgi:hypothetical protein